MGGSPEVGRATFGRPRSPSQFPGAESLYVEDTHSQPQYIGVTVGESFTKASRDLHRTATKAGLERR